MLKKGNTLKIIKIYLLFFSLLSCELNVTDTQHIDINYYEDNDKNKKLAEDLMYYDARYIASNVPLLTEKTGPSIQLGYFIRSSDNKPSYQIIYSLKNPDVAKNIDDFKKQFNLFIPKLAAFHASKEPIFNKLKPIGSVWVGKLFTDEANTLLNESSDLLKKSVNPEQFLKMTAELSNTYGKALSITFIRAQYYKEFSTVPESVSLFYIASFSNKNKLLIRISMHKQEQRWQVMGFQYQKTNA